MPTVPGKYLLSGRFTIELLIRFQDVNDDELELDIDQIPEPVLVDLLRYIRSVRPKARRASNANQAHHGGLHDDDYEPNPRNKGGAPTGSRKKNKPMSKAQQEASIQAIENQLNAFSGNAPPPVSGNAVMDSSSDDESASESEEE
jgi:bromodomain-containing factor 1